MGRSNTVWCICILALIIVALFFTFDTAYSHPGSTTATAVTRSAWLDVGRVKLPLNNCGGFTPFYRTDYQGGYWPDTTDFQNNVILFDWGPWVVGKVNGVPMMGFSQWGSCYSPGPVINGQAAMNVSPGDSLRYRVYRIAHGDNAQTNPDYRDWPSDLGAPLDESGNPKVSGDQTVWTVFNNLDTNARVQHWNGSIPLARLPVEIQQTAYAHGVVQGDTTALLANVAFIEWTIINTGDAPIESTYVSLWTDVDFSATWNNRPAIDTLNQLAYCWQSADWPYSGPRAVGFVWLYGPVVPSSTDVAVFKGNPRPGYRNLPISSFYGIQDDSGGGFNPAYNTAAAWNIARGLDGTGHAIIDSVTRQATKFPFSGDPVTGTGWICQSAQGGAGFNIFSGPFTMAPHDTQWAMAALVPVGASDRMQCVELLRQRAALLRKMSHDSFVESAVNDRPAPLPASVELQQNFPNPFNPSTTIRYALPQRSQVTLGVYNTLGQQVATLVNGEMEAGYHEVTFSANGGSASGGNATRLASGVYFYRIQGDKFNQVRKLLLLR
jgi:hypothetical protein